MYGEYARIPHPKTRKIMWKPGQLITINRSVCRVTKVRWPIFGIGGSVCGICRFNNDYHPPCTQSGPKTFTEYDCMYKIKHMCYPQNLAFIHTPIPYT